MDDLDMINPDAVLKSLQTLDPDHPLWVNMRSFINNSDAIYNNTISNDPQMHLLLERYTKNRSINGPVVYVLITIYSLLILFGVFGNLVIVSAVIRKTAMRTVRNMFIINLAVSDLLLCIVTMPLTLIESLTVYWPFGENEIVCKLVGCLQAVCVFVSTFSIAAIALDRYSVIIYPTRSSLKKLGAALSLFSIWVLAGVLVSPLFVWKKLVHENLQLYGLPIINFCIEDWPIEDGSLYYSIFTIIIQCSLPIIVICIAYARICIKLRNRRRPGGRLVEAASSDVGGTVRRDTARVHRTNTLLISIALIFVICWMPWNMLMVILYLYEPFKYGGTYNKELERISFILCHLVAMTSACCNPVLNGWLNENFRKEFRDIWSSVKVFFCHPKDNNNGRSDGTGSESLRVGVSVQEPTVHFKKTKAPTTTTIGAGEVEQSTLITHVLDRQK